MRVDKSHIFTIKAASLLAIQVIQKWLECLTAVGSGDMKLHIVTYITV